MQAAVEMSESLALTCPLHPTAADVAPMASWFASKGNGAQQPERWTPAKWGADERDSMSLSVQLFTTASPGTLRCPNQLISRYFSSCLAVRYQGFGD
jgi:hypothetical protein